MQIIKKNIVFTILVAGLGYFVDIYDLLLFGIVRMPSLRALGVPENEMMNIGLHLLNMQMAGMLIGGVLWGILGDKRGRKSVMFGSILLYSICNIANAFVADTETYAWLRFFAGIGLAGELGAAITLVSEIMPKETRGYGTAIVAGIGILGAVFASLIGDYFNWKIAYLVGGGMGLGLLALRASLLESGMFETMTRETVRRGQFFRLLMNPKTLGRYLSCILIGVPNWFMIGILITFAPELSKEIGVVGEVTGSNAIMWSYLGISIGDVAAGVLSQWLRSRKKTVLIYLIAASIMVVFYRFAPKMTSHEFYLLCFFLGLAIGYWAILVTVGAEQFGTNIRATVATTVPNFVRGSVVPMVFTLGILRPHLGLLNSVLTIGLVVMGISFVALYFLRETFGKDLDYFESF